MTAQPPQILTTHTTGPTTSDNINGSQNVVYNPKGRSITAGKLSLNESVIDLVNPLQVTLIHDISLEPTFTPALLPPQQLQNETIWLTTLSHQDKLWQPDTILPPHETDHPFQHILTNQDNSLIIKSVQGDPSTIISRSANNHQISITIQDLRELLTHNSPIYHELIILSLEVISHHYNSHYLDPSFFTNLQLHGWSYISNWFAPSNAMATSRPSLQSSIITIPVHINNNHWVAMCRRYFRGQVEFYFADDLNNPSTER
jgi:hypothetical protein